MEARTRPISVPTTLRATRGAVALALAIGLAITAIVAWDVHHSIHKEARLHFDGYGDRLADAMGGRVRSIETGLRGARAMIASHGSIDRLRFRRFVAARQMAFDFPGVRAFGFVERVRRADLAAFVARERADHAPEFAVRTSGNAPDLLVVRPIPAWASTWARIPFAAPARSGPSKPASRPSRRRWP
jgi:CHASE1-domain containing sensor protein